MTPIEEFLINQIMSDSKGIEYLNNSWKEPRTPHQNHIIGVLFGKCYGYLNVLKQICVSKDSSSFERINETYRKNILKLDMIK